MFVNLEKAFNNIPLKDFFYTLEEIGADYKDKRIINNLYINQSAIIRVTDKLEKTILPHQFYLIFMSGILSINLEKNFLKTK